MYKLLRSTCTVSEDEYWPIGPVWSKWVLFIKVFCYVKALPCSYPPDMFEALMRPFKWGTAWSFISRGIRIITSQSQNCQKSVLLLSKFKSLTFGISGAHWWKDSCSTSFLSSHWLIKHIWLARALQYFYIAANS